MPACGRADDAAVRLSQDTETLTFQLAELEDLRGRVLVAEQGRRRAKPSRNGQTNGSAETASVRMRREKRPCPDPRRAVLGDPTFV